MPGKVFSVTDFKAGLDVRKTPLTAPGGILRILENAVLNQGGEIEKRQAFVYMTTIPAELGRATTYMIGHCGALHVFGFVAAHTIPPGSLPVPIVCHHLAGTTRAWRADNASRSSMSSRSTTSSLSAADGGRRSTYCWYNGVLVTLMPQRRRPQPRHLRAHLEVQDVPARRQIPAVFRGQQPGAERSRPR